jgi:acyl-CoA-binding protein
MSELTIQERFDAACETVKNFPEHPSIKGKQKAVYYGLYKQAMNGDVKDSGISRPSFLNYPGQVKWDAWKNCEGMTSDEAKEQYADMVEEAAKTFER